MHGRCPNVDTIVSLSMIILSIVCSMSNPWNMKFIGIRRVELKSGLTPPTRKPTSSSLRGMNFWQPQASSGHCKLTLQRSDCFGEYSRERNNKSAYMSECAFSMGHDKKTDNFRDTHSENTMKRIDFTFSHCFCLFIAVFPLFFRTLTLGQARIPPPD